MQINTQSFILPHELHAAFPPERRGIRRDHVRMMTIDRKTGKVIHDSFNHLADYVKPGDMIVLNNSRTIPAALKATIDNTSQEIEVRLARSLSETSWEALVLSANVKIGDCLHFSDELSAVVTDIKRDSPLLVLRFSISGLSLIQHVYSLGEPIRYEYIEKSWDLHYYQNVYGTVPGSVELASAGRAFSWEMLLDLQKRGIQLSYLQLHTGLSYLNDNDQLSPEDNIERYDIPKETMAAVLKTKATGGRVIAVGTTVVRALESAVSTGIFSGETALYIDAAFPLKIVDGIITGFHEPEASHLDMLTAFIKPEILFDAYGEAIREKYLWHEFGDINFIV